MNKLELEILALSHSVTQSQSYAVVLQEVDGNRRLPIIIGVPEAQAIAVAMEGLKPTRPLTHDLLKSVCDTFEIRLLEVIISDMIEGIFYAKLICQQGGNILEIDSRTSDALALAVRFSCPIYTYENILDSAGLTPEPSEQQPIVKDNSPQKAKNKKEEEGYGLHSLKKLNKLLEDAIVAEDYEKAARLRDEIDKRDAR